MLRFTFDSAVIGFLPTQAGIVWTDVGFGGGFSAPVTFEAFGPDDVSLGEITPNEPLGDGSDAGQTGEDRFFGVFNSDGVTAIELRMNNGDWEVDHVQYGVPEPSTLLLIGVGCALFGVAPHRGRRSHGNRSALH